MKLRAVTLGENDFSFMAKRMVKLTFVCSKKDKIAITCVINVET